MKKIFTIFSLLVSFGAFAQQTVTQKTGAPNVLIRNMGAGSFDSAVYLPNRDTTFTPSQPSAIIVRQADGLAYLWTGGPWKPLGSPVWGKITGSLSNQIDLYDSLQARQRALLNGYGWFVNASGAGTFDSAHVRKVDTMYRLNDSTIAYTINGIPYTALLRGTAAGGINSLVLTVPGALFTTPVTFSNTGGAWTGTLALALQAPGTIFAGPASGASATPTFRQMALSDLPTGIPNANLANSTLGLSIDQVGSTPAFSATSVALGSTIILHLPFASATTSGPLTATDWNRFNSNSGGAVTSVNGQIGNVSVYNADSIGGFPVIFTNFHNGWVIAADTVNHRIVFQAPGSGSGIVSLNSLNATTQYFAIGTSGTSPNISSATATHTFNFPYVNGADSGLVTPALYATWNAKQPAGNYITALTGQVTAAGPGSAAATIAASTVTNSNLALMSGGTIKSNLTGSSANPSDNTVSAVATAVGQYIGNTPSGGFPLWNQNIISIRELFAGTNVTIDSTTHTGGYTINSTGSGGVAQIFAKAPLYILGTDTVRADTTLGHTGALSTINFTYQKIDSLAGITYIQYPRQGLSPRGGDSIVLGGILSAFFQADTIYTAGYPWYWLGLSNRVTPGATDSLAMVAANGQVLKTAFPSGTPVTPTNNGLMTPALLARLDSTLWILNAAAYPFLDSMGFGSLHHDSLTLKRFQLAATSLFNWTDSGNLYKNAYGLSMANQTAGTLLGYDGTTGVAEVIQLGTGLSMTGNTLNNTGGGGSNTFQNGITNTAGTVTLGGVLTQNTSITQSGYTFAITGGAIGLGTAATTSSVLTVGMGNYNSSYGTGTVLGGSTSNDPITAASGNVTVMAANRIKQTTVTATNTGVTYTTGANLYVDGNLAAGTNTSITNPYGIYSVGNIGASGDISAGTTIGNNAFFQAGANTTTTASLFLAPSSAVNVTSPTSGMMWWNGTNLYFYNGSTNKDLLASSSGFTNPMTTTGDLILGGSGGTATRLGIGANNYVLTSNGTTASWQAATGGGGDAITSPNSTLSVGGTSSATTLDLNLTHSNTWVGANQIFQQNGNATTVTDAVYLQNTTAATSGTTAQYSPALHFEGTGWVTGSTASQVADTKIYIVTASGSAQPSNTLYVDMSHNGGAATHVAEFNEGSGESLTGSYTATANFFAGSTGGFTWGAGGTTPGLYSDSAYSFSARQSTHAEEFRLMNTYTAVGNQGFFRISHQLTSNVVNIGPYNYGAAPSETVTAVGTWTFASAPILTTSSTVGQAWIATGTSGQGGWGNVVTSGTYTATITTVSNCTSPSSGVGHYTRNGNQVSVDIPVTVNLTVTATATEYYVSLPVSSTISSGSDLTGMGTSVDPLTSGLGISGNTTNHVADVTFTPTGTGSNNMYLHFTYTVD